MNSEQLKDLGATVPSCWDASLDLPEDERVYWSADVISSDDLWADESFAGYNLSPEDAVAESVERGATVVRIYKHTLEQAIANARQWGCSAVVLRAKEGGEWVVIQTWPV